MPDFLTKRQISDGEITMIQAYKSKTLRFSQHRSKSPVRGGRATPKEAAPVGIERTRNPVTVPPASLTDRLSCISRESSADTAPLLDHWVHCSKFPREFVDAICDQFGCVNGPALLSDMVSPPSCKDSSHLQRQNIHHKGHPQGKPS